MKILILVHCGQVVEDRLELVLLDPVTHEDQLLDKQKHERTNRDDLILRWTGTIYNEKVRTFCKYNTYFIIFQTHKLYRISKVNSL